MSTLAKDNPSHDQPAGGSVQDSHSSPHLIFTRAEWARLRDGTPLNLSAEELERLKGLNERVSLDEVETIYLPMCRLLNLYVGATQDLFKATAEFLGHPEPKVPYVIGLAGSVAVGKSTTGRILQTLLSRWPNSPKVDLLTTDGFLYPNRVLEERGLMKRKGFPESYDQSSLLAFVSDIKAGEGAVKGPVYSHLTYDIVEGEYVEVDRPDIVIIEGLNVLQTAPTQKSTAPRLFVSDFFDFSIYVDASVEDLRRWYVARFLTLRNTAFRDPSSYFHRYASMTDDEARHFANSVWSEINEVNLRENILPTRERADLILEKSADHSVRRVQLRKI